jgi:hypothetical protein
MGWDWENRCSRGVRKGWSEKIRRFVVKFADHHPVGQGFFPPISGPGIELNDSQWPLVLGYDECFQDLIPNSSPHFPAPGGHSQLSTDIKPEALQMIYREIS